MAVNLYSSARALTTAVKDINRMREIVTVLARHGFGEVLNRLGLTETLGLKNLVSATDDDDTPLSTAKQIRLSIEELGPTFVKLGQILSTRPDLVPPAVIEELSHLQDNVPELDWADVKEVVETELGGPISDYFSGFDETPLACASIAQVHRAVLANDASEVVVKVQRPRIAGRIDSDLNILHVLAKLIEARAPDLALMDPVGIVTEFEKAIRKELDFNGERRNIGRFQINFAEFEGLRVPRVYDQVSTSRILTMEFIEGVKITLAPEKLGVDPYEIAPRMLRALFKMIFQDGVFHGDLHPGNILILPDASIVLIDFGLVGRLAPRQREHILDILIGLAQQDYELVARVMFELGVKVPGVTYDFDAFQSDVVEVMEKHLAGRTLQEMDVGAYFTDLVAGAIRHQIKMPPTYTMVFKALMTIEGIGKSLAPEINLVEEAQPFVKEMVAERYSPKRMMKEGFDGLNALSRFLRLFPNQAGQLLRDLNEGRTTVRVGLMGIDDALDTQRVLARRRNRVLMFCACLLSGSIALSAPVPEFMRLLGMPIVAWLLFGLGGFVGLGVMASFFRK
ncbi:MAG: AarF/ABC1/UbiB kinase family protein [Myxococcales bacterium]|nr:AarF/ABC1/UbiB kinase family protein [Myxococcales bacterium]